MADDLIFPIKFDLEKGVKDALTDGDKALDRIAKALEKHPITIKLRMDNRVARGASAELTGFKKQLAELTQQWNSLTAAERGSAAGAAIREKFRALRTEAQGYTSTLQAAVKAEDKMRESHSKTEASANKLSSAYHNQSTYLSRLIQRMAAYAGVSYVGNFLTNVREVTAQFELQRISLGAIIQDQQRANQLFEEIKTFALKSPVKILDLTKYTKQLAAYKIGVDELFDTTKRLTDVSVGLGVSMDRVVLAYGQVRARGALYSSEIRQFTEMGVPIVEELAAKLTKMNGELVTSAQVLDLVQKGAISFDMVKEVFDDMTSAGGIFYNMQEKQGNTLFGMWQKLGDAAAVMYDQIGNTSSVNEGMKMAIQTLRYLMLHWKQVGIVVGGVSVYILANTVATKNNAIATAAATTANKLHIASLQQKLGALRLEQMNLKSTAIFQRLHTAATISATKAQIGAATSTNVFSKALYGLKAALLSNPLTALAVALTTIIALLMQSESELDKLNSKLQDIDRDYDASGKKSVDRFKELMKAVEENVDGSKAQKEALDELDRTYGKILGSEALELDSLKAMGGQYEELIDLINAYNAKKRGKEKETAIRSTAATIKDEAKDDLMDYLNQAGMSKEKQIEFIAALDKKMLEYNDAIKATDETFNEFANDISRLDAAGNILNVLDPDKLFDAWGVSFRQLGGLLGGKGMDFLYDYAKATQTENDLLEENEKQTRLAADAMGAYSSSIDGLNKSFANLDWSSKETLSNSLKDYNSKHPENMISVPIDLSFDPAKAETEYDKLLETSNMKINAIFSVLQQIARQEGQTIPEEFYKQAKSVVEGNKDFSFIDWAKLEEQFKSSPKALAAIRASKQLYESIAPSDDTVRMFNRKFMALASNMDVSLDKMQKYLMKSGDNLGEHRKKLSDEVTNLLKEIARLEWTKKALSLFGLPTAAVEAKIQESQQTLKLLQSMISTIPDIEGKGKKGGSKSDPRLQTLQEIANKMVEVNKEYDELLKKEGQTKAIADTQKLFASSFKQMEATAKKYGFKLPAFEMPQTIEDVQKWYKAIMDNIKRLNLKNADKVLIELGFKSDKAAIDKQQNDIEKQLKELADRISRTKTAKEFYEKILRLTRNEDLAFRATFSVFGQDKLDTFTDEVEQLKQNFGEIDITAAINLNTKQIDYKALREIWETDKALPDNLRKIPQAYDSAIKSILDAGDKLSEKQFERWSRDLERAKQYYDKRIELAQYTEEQIAEIEAKRDSLNPNSKGYERDRAMYDRMIKDYREREKNEGAKLDYEQIKEQIGMFDDIGIRLSESFKRILEQLREYTQSSEFARLGQEAQKNVYEQIDKLEDRIREGFQGIGVGTVSTLVRDYSFAASQYLNAQEELKNATFAAIEADRNLTAVKNTGNEEAIKAAEAEKALADARVQSASATVNAASTDLMRTQHNAERASKQFEGNLERIGNSIRSLNNGALKPLWDMLGPKVHRKIGELLSGGSKLIKAAEKLQKAIDETEGGLGGFSESITKKILKATQDIDPEDIEAITEATNNTLVEAFKGMGFGEDIAKYMADTMTKTVVAELASKATADAISGAVGQSTEALIQALAKGGQSSGNLWGAIIGLILQLLDEFAENGVGEFIKTLLENVGDAVNGILSELLETTIPGILEGVGELVQQVAYGIVNLLTFSAFDLGGRKAMKKANKLIEEQGKILKDLEYRYDRLGKIAEKVFGSDYIDNYNQQLKNLQAQQEAYLKQAEAEKSKGKKEDEEKTQEYLDKARDIGDQIADMQEDLIEHFTGSSRTDIARQMAQSWIDARASMSDTFAAIKGDYQDLIKNMLVETMAAKIIENAFSQVWKDVDERLKDNDVEGAVNAFINGMDTALTNANDGMEVWWKAMEARGFDMKNMFSNMDSEYTGIAKSVAGATSEEINNVAAIGNTLMYYVSPIPRMDENLARVVAIMEGRGASSVPQTTSAGWTDWQQQAMDNYNAIARNTADTVVECRRAAEACERITRLIKTKGAVSGLNVFLNS